MPSVVETLESLPAGAPEVLRPLLERLPRSGDWYFAASTDRQSPAYGVMRIAGDIQAGCLVDLFTTGKRPEGARPVLEGLEAIARSRGCRSLVWSVEDSPRYAAMEPVLHGSGWDRGCHLRSVEFEFARVAQAPWVRQRPRARDCEIVVWSEVSQAERADMAHRQRVAPWYPESLSPFPQEACIESSCSLALRYRGEVAGWSISTRHSADTVYIAVLFVRSDLQARGAGASLIAETLRRGAESPFRSALFEVESQRAAMLRFADRHLRPYITRESVVRRNWKVL